MKLDRIDRRILDVLQRDGRISNLDLAERVGLSATPCARRVKRLEDSFDAFEAQVRDFPEVMECSVVTGQSADYLLKAVIPDMQHYERFLLGKLTRIPGVTGVHSSFELRRVVQNTVLPLDHVENDTEV